MPDRPPSRPLFKWGAVVNFALIALGLTCAGLGVASLGGSKIRPLFGASASALAGPAPAARPDGGHVDAGSPY